VLENTNFNKYHGTKKATFYYFECEDNLETGRALFEAAFDWARARGLDMMIGPKGFGALDGYGILIDGFQHRQLMTMMNYNHPYLPKMMEELGFEKEVDFLSCYVEPQKYDLPERVQRIAERVVARGTLHVLQFKNKKELVAWAPRIGQAYNQAFIRNWEYVPLTEREIDFVVENILTIADPKLFKIIVHGEDVVGFLFVFPDISAALQRCKGNLFPFGIFDILLEMKRTEWVALNGEGILEEFQGKGGNALLYSEIKKTVDEYGFKYVDAPQVAETAVQMRRDLINLGAIPYKTHRVFRRSV
jgi:GNAT superfamily N-acetyltransferase